MNGVEILASNEVAIAWASWNWEGFLIAIAIAFGVALVTGFIAGLSEMDRTLGLAIFLALFIVGGGLFGTFLGITTGKPIEYETQYKVTIDDTVSMNEFIEKYEILDQECKIYTVRERE